MALNELELPTKSDKQIQRTAKKEVAEEEKPAYLRGKSSVHAQPASDVSLFDSNNVIRASKDLVDETMKGKLSKPGEIAQVNYVYDGDTLILGDGRKVRLLGINAPEINPPEAGGTESRDALRKLFKDNTNISLVFGKGQKDKYGRLLAHVLTQDGKNVQQVLLAQGHAKALNISPNERMNEVYAEIEKDAKKQGKGIWKQPIETVPEGYVPAWQRDDVYASEGAPIAPTPILEDAGARIMDEGLLTWGRQWVIDLFREDASADDEKAMIASVDSMIETAGIHPANKTKLLEQAQSVEHMQQLVDHILDQQRKAPGREAQSFGAAATSGLLGFGGDLANWIPGMLMLKTGKFVATAAPKFANVITKAAPTLTSSKAVKWGAFGAVEEAIRSYPRLQSDITFDMEDYLTNAGLGAAFGVGLMKGIPAAKWMSDKTIAPAFKSLNAAIDKSFRKAQESHKLRTAGNLIATAAKHSKKVATNKNVKELTDDMDSGGWLRNASKMANEQVAQAKTLNRLKDTAVRFANRLNKKDIDLADPEIQADLQTALRDSLKVSEGKNVQAALDAFDNKIAEMKAREAVPTLSTKDGVAEIKPKTFPEAIKEVEGMRQAALDIVNTSKSKHKNAMIASVEANSLQAVRALEAAAARQGVKVVRRTAKRSDIIKTVSDRIQKLIPDRANKNFIALSKKLKFDGTGRTLQAPFVNAMKHSKITPSGNARDSVLKHILSDPKKVRERATAFRENVTTEYNKLKDEIEDAYTGHPNDKEFLRAKELLRESQEEIEFTLDWTAMSWERKASDLNKLDPRWALLSDEYENAMGAETRKKIHEMYDSFSQRLVKNQFGRLTRSLGSDLVASKVPLAEWQAMNIFELAPGLGGLIDRPQTAVILAERHMSKILTPALMDYNDLMDAAAKDLGKGLFGSGLMKRMNPHSGGDVQEINRMVMREMNARQRGANIDVPSYIKDYATKLSKTNEQLYNLQRDHGIEGITGANKMNHYLRQSWRDGAILDMIDNTNIGRSGLIELFSKSLVSRADGAIGKKEGNALAETLIDLKLEAMNKPTIDNVNIRSDNMTGSMAELEKVFKRLSDNGKEREIEVLMKWVREDVGGQPGYVNKRFINLDYETTITKNGQEVSILDLLDNDVIGQVNRYSKEASGRAALAESSGGRLTSEQSINDLLQATAQQANDMGTHVNIKDLRNAYRQMLGLPYDGQLPMDIRKIRDAISLAGMNGLGESQLAELGLSINRGLAGMFAMNQLGSKTVGRFKQWRRMELTESQQKNMDFLDELQESSRLYEDMHMLQRQNVHFDARESQATTSMLSKIVDTGTGGKYRPYMQYLQTRYTGYSSVRTMEEQLAMASLMQDAMKAARGNKSFTSDPRFRDVGLDTTILKRKLDDGTIILREDGNIESLNMHRWSKADQQAVGVALQRHAGQQVQRAFVGEISPLLADPRVAFLMQFKSYPLLAAEKQQGRNLLFADKEAAMGITLNAASSAAARAIRYYSMALALPSEKRERYLEHKFTTDFGHDTAAYMGIVGMMVNNWDMAQDLVFGNEGNIGDQLPAINWGNNLLEAAQSANPLKEGEYTERDVANGQRGAPLGTIMYVNMLMGVIRTMMDTDTDNTYRENRNRGN